MGAPASSSSAAVFIAAIFVRAILFILRFKSNGNCRQHLAERPDGVAEEILIGLRVSRRNIREDPILDLTAIEADRVDLRLLVGDEGNDPSTILVAEPPQHHTQHLRVSF